MHSAPQSKAGVKLILICLAIGVFAVGTEGFMIAGVLPGIASELNVSEAAAGHLVTAFSLAYAVGSPALTVAFAGIQQRRLIGLAMMLFAFGNALAAAAPTYGVLMLARVVLALSAGIFMPAALNAAGMMVAPEMRGRALALVNCGGAIALMIGVPLGALIGAMAGWRVAFVLVSILSGAAGSALLTRLPDLSVAAPGVFGDRINAIRQREIWISLVTTLFWAMGINVLYTFVAVYLRQVAGAGPEQLGIVLFGIGVTSSIGAYIGGVATDRWGAVRVRLVAIAAMAIIYLAIALTGAMERRGSVLTVALSIQMAMCAGVAWVFYAAQQVRLLKLATVSGGATLVSLNASSMYLGFASGAAAGATMLHGGHISGLAWISTTCEIIGLSLLMVMAAPRPIASEGVEAMDSQA